MNIFKFSDYDCIGFDLDNTLLKFNLTNMTQLEYDLLTKFLVIQKGYNSKHLLKPLSDFDWDFMQRGLILDLENGNVLKLNSDGIIQAASHGTRPLTAEEISVVYPNKRWKLTDDFYNDMFSTWNGPTSMKMRSLLDYFDLPVSLIFAKLIDTVDEECGKVLNSYDVWPDILSGLEDMFNREQFSLNKGGYFSAIKSEPDKYLHKCNPKTISWLNEVKRNSMTFLLTGSNADFAEFTARYALGENWRDYFDIVVCFAKKPGFFINKRPFVSLLGLEENCIVSSKDLKCGETYSQGNWNDLINFIKIKLAKDDPSCLYIGDNLLQDIYIPVSRMLCDTVAVIAEQVSEGMPYQQSVQEHSKVLNSKYWDSYFSFTKDKMAKDTYWGYIIKTYAKICIPELEFVAQNPMHQKITSFNKINKDCKGYYPSAPISLVTL
ncbi:5'-nucleotidase domain-containing protein 1 isoform X2 [Prorops nasuta]